MISLSRCWPKRLRFIQSKHHNWALIQTRVVVFKTAKGWSRDVTRELADGGEADDGGVPHTAR